MAAQLNHFGAVNTDVLREFGQGVALSDFDTTSGVGDGATEIDGMLDDAESDIISWLPSDYRTMLIDRVRAEVLLEYTYKDQIVFKTHFEILDDVNDQNNRNFKVWPNVRIWRNWDRVGINPDPASPIDAFLEIGRDESDASFTVAVDNQSITFAGFEIGEADQFLIDYRMDVSALDIPELKRVVVRLAAYEGAKRLFQTGEAAFDMMRQIFEDAMDDLKRIQGGTRRIEFLADVRLNKDRKVGRPSGHSPSIPIGRA